MPIISRLPWTTKQIGDETAICDADGKVIGHFHDWQDAERSIAGQDTIEKLQTQIEKINDILSDKVNSAQLALQWLNSI